MPPKEKELNARIQRIENGLISEADANKPNPPTHTLAARMKDHFVPGVSVAVFNNYEIEWARGYGSLKARRSTPVVNTDTLFQAASISKPVTAAAVMRLVQDGRLSLDDDVNQYLVSWKVPANGDWQPVVTLRQLLTHTAGMTTSGFLGYAHEQAIPTVLQVLNGEKPANSDPIRVDTLPGVQMRYSGGGTTIVQQLLVDVVGKSFPELMRELVLDPLNMRRSRFEHPLPPRYWPNAARGHYYNGHPIQGKWHAHPELAAAGLWTTPSDLARFAIALQHSIAGQSESFLSREIASEMLTPHMESEFGGHVGVGFMMTVKDTSKRFGHGGSNVGYRCNLVAYEDGGLGAAIMTNGDQGDSLYEEIRRAIAREYQWPAFLPVPQSPTTVDAAVQAAYAGHYELESGIKLTIKADKGRLYLQHANQPAIELQPTSETEYFAEVVNFEVRFNKGEGGKVSELVFKQNGRDLSVKRM